MRRPMTDEGARALGAGIVWQAVVDYKDLCRLVSRGKIIELDGGALSGGPRFAPKFGSGAHGDRLPKETFRQIERWVEQNADFFSGLNPDTILPRMLEWKMLAKEHAKKRFAKL